MRSYPQLGLILNEKMNWDAHIENIISKANKKIGLIWRLCNHVPRFAVENIYTTYIRPQLNTVPWSTTTAQKKRSLDWSYASEELILPPLGHIRGQIPLHFSKRWDGINSRPEEHTYMSHINVQTDKCSSSRIYDIITSINAGTKRWVCLEKREVIYASKSHYREIPKI